MLVLALFCALLSGLSGAKAQPVDVTPTLRVHELSLVGENRLNTNSERIWFEFNYHVEDLSGNGLQSFTIELEQIGSPGIIHTSERIVVSYKTRATGVAYVPIQFGYGDPEGEYELTIKLVRNGGGDGNIYEGPIPSLSQRFVIYNDPNGPGRHAPILHRLELVSPRTIDVADEDGVFVFEYEAEDIGEAGLRHLIIELKPPVGVSAPSMRTRGAYFDGEQHASGRIEYRVPQGTMPLEYRVIILSFQDRIGMTTYSQEPGPVSPQTVTVEDSSQGGNPDGDNYSPTIISLDAEERDFVVTPDDRNLQVNYHFTDSGGSGLDRLELTFEHKYLQQSQRSIHHTIDLSGSNEDQGSAEVEFPLSVLSGEYVANASVYDAAGNGNYSRNAFHINISNEYEDRQPPFFQTLVLPDPVFVAPRDRDFTIPIRYEVIDPGTSGLDYLEMRFQGNYRADVERIDLNGAERASGIYQLPVPAYTWPGEYMLEVGLSDIQGNRAFTLNSSIQTPHSDPDRIFIIYEGQQLFGPYLWGAATTGLSRDSDIYRLTGLSSPPSQIVASVNSFADFNCSLEINENRHSGQEYLITRHDLQHCMEAKEFTILRFLVTPAESDADSDLEMRRFRISPTGMITDMADDAAPVILTMAQRNSEFIEFGPFEWASTAENFESMFLISGYGGSQPLPIDIAVSDAAQGDYAGDYSDCRYTVPVEASSIYHARIVPASELGCGDFGRANLMFRASGFTTHPSWNYPPIHRDFNISRIVSSHTGAISNLSFDTNNTATGSSSQLDNDFTATVFGPFEWTGDANAPTQSLFRLTGIEGGLPTSISVALGNASIPDFEDDFLDCELQIDETRAGDNDYLIHSSDLSACGGFGRADLRFRIVAPTSSMDADGLQLRRLAIGAHGDITDFGFDLDASAAITPTPIANGLAEIEFGPFEWTGDHTVSTQNVFRISGLSGAPESIDLALMNATQDGYQGDFTDCSLQIRPNRAGRNEFVIASSDLVDCDGFLRADIRFRVRAQADQFADEVRMRRFAVTRNGGLTDFGFDTQSRP